MSEVEFWKIPVSLLKPEGPPCWMGRIGWLGRLVKTRKSLVEITRAEARDELRMELLPTGEPCVRKDS